MPAEGLLAARTLDGWIAAARAALSGDDTRLTFRTSGSSGTPKRCTHRLAALWEEVNELALLVPGRRRVLSAVPAHHVYGFLFTVLLPRAGAALPVTDLRAAAPGAVVAQLLPGDLMVAHPDFWDLAASSEPRFPADVVGISSTAPLRDASARALASGGLRLLQVYGSSETAGVGWRDTADAPYRLFSYWRRGEEEGTIERETGGEGERFALQDRLSRAGLTPSSRRAASTRRYRWAARMCSRLMWPRYWHCTRRWRSARCGRCGSTRAGA
ncbi:AMP-binding protein [Massilia sp. Dwa41.01b]|uniref:AMP-binding protein n=1 Tax=Massilia sp. Dwa41.01b TaxID=2709302 RepID=UPI00191DECAE|nr:AMP-binding protein [Massilia sp. Dwa41.01b]